MRKNILTLYVSWQYLPKWNAPARRAGPDNLSSGTVSSSSVGITVSNVTTIIYELYTKTCKVLLCDPTKLPDTDSSFYFSFDSIEDGVFFYIDQQKYDSGRWNELWQICQYSCWCTLSVEYSDKYFGIWHSGQRNYVDKICWWNELDWWK